MKPDRPLSPHLQIYRPQLTSVLSILHRLTGVALSFGAFLLVGFLWALARGETSFSCYLTFFSSFFGKLILLKLGFCFFYHLGNGIRHLFWDGGQGFDLKSAYQSGWGVVFFAGVMSLFMAFWIFFKGAGA